MARWAPLDGSAPGQEGEARVCTSLRLRETFALAEVERAIEDALRMGTLSFDAVKHLLLPPIEQRAGAVGSGELSPSAPGSRGDHRGRRLPRALGCWLRWTRPRFYSIII